MSYVLDGGQFDHAIESLVRRSFEHELTPQKELIGTGKSLIAFAEVAPERARDFAAERADAALRLHLLLKARLVRDRMTAFYETIERPLVAGRRGDGAGRDQGRPRGARRAVARFRAAHRRDRDRDLSRCRQRFQHRLDQATGRRAVRQARPARRQKGQDRRLRHRRLDPRGTGAAARGAARTCSNGGS